MPLSIEELTVHPGMKDVIIPFAPDKSGLALVAQNRGGPFKIHYEIHGTGPIHLVFIMGLGAPLIAWQRQIKYFGHKNGKQFSMLVFDNRGVGASDKPLMRYSTSEMAQDVIDLLDHIEWKAHKSLHVVGASMGGMIVRLLLENSIIDPNKMGQCILAFFTTGAVNVVTEEDYLYFVQAQELAYYNHERIASIVFQSTAAAIRSEVSFLENIRRRAALLRPKSLQERLDTTRDTIFGSKYLAEPDRMGVFPTNADRFNAEELWKIENINQPPFLAFVAQLIAAGWHYCGPERLAFISEHVEHILVCYGLQDKMIEPPHSKYLLQQLGPRTQVREFPDAGHVISVENVHEYNAMVHSFVKGTSVSSDIEVSAEGGQ